MMREIKFRQAILDRGGSFSKWHYWGFIEQYGDLTYVGPETNSSTIQGALENSYQYINRHDRNDKEICDRDIVECVEMHDCNLDYWVSKPPRFEITWNISGYWMIESCPPSMFALIPLDIHRYWEIIGNIHENPELLETSDK